MTNFILSDGITPLAINPDWDLKFDHRKIESVHHTLGGAQYRYVWGVYRHVKFRIDFVNSSYACSINNWHGSSSAVDLDNEGGVSLFSGYLSNASAPIDQFVKPFTDQFMGTIELEENVRYTPIRIPANIVC